jgi:hypothetical protein
MALQQMEKQIHNQQTDWRSQCPSSEADAMAVHHPLAMTH